MLPSEKSEIWLWRIAVGGLVLMVLIIVIWIAHNAYTSLKRIHKAYDIPKDEGRAPVARIAAVAVSTPRLFASSTPRPLA